MLDAILVGLHHKDVIRSDVVWHVRVQGFVTGAVGSRLSQLAGRGSAAKNAAKLFISEQRRTAGRMRASQYYH